MAHEHSHIDGKCYPSVTEIIYSQPKPWLDKWYAKYGQARCERKTAIANKIGTEFHRCAEVISQGNVPDTKCPRVLKMLPRVHEWLSNVQLAPYATEMKVYSNKHGYQGTLDLVGEVDGKLYIVDYKSSAGIKEDMGLQLVAYAKAYGEMTGVYPALGKIVLVKKDKPDFRLVTKDFELTDKLFDKFLRIKDEMVKFPCPYLKVQ
jgi:hypothetical protein